MLFPSHQFAAAVGAYYKDAYAAYFNQQKTEAEMARHVEPRKYDPSCECGYCAGLRTAAEAKTANAWLPKAANIAKYTSVPSNAWLSKNASMPVTLSDLSKNVKGFALPGSRWMAKCGCVLTATAEVRDGLAVAVGAEFDGGQIKESVPCPMTKGGGHWGIDVGSSVYVGRAPDTADNTVNPAKPQMAVGSDGKSPAACLRCGVAEGKPANLWMHGDCWTANDNESNGWADEWDKGARDFPRPAKAVRKEDEAIGKSLALPDESVKRYHATTYAVRLMPAPRYEVSVNGRDVLDYSRLGNAETPADPVESYPFWRVAGDAKRVTAWDERCPAMVAAMKGYAKLAYEATDSAMAAKMWREKKTTVPKGKPEPWRSSVSDEDLLPDV